MTNFTAGQKSITESEFGLTLAMLALSVLSLFIWAKAYTTAYAFHAALFCVGGALAAFAIIMRHEKRPARLPPAEIEGKPNYNLGPIRFASLAAVVWGIAGFTRRTLYRARARLSGAQFRSFFHQFRPPAAAAYISGDFRLRRQRADRDIVLCRAAHMPRAARGRSRALVRRRSATTSSSSSRARAICSASRAATNTRSRNGTRSSGSSSCGSPISSSSWSRWRSARSRISMSPTGSTSPSSSPSRCSCSATTPRFRSRSSPRSPIPCGRACRTR